MLNSRKISIIHVGGFRPTGNPFASHFGLSPLALPEERWPTYFSSTSSAEIKNKKVENLFFICQLNLTDAPYVPEILADIKLITIFVSPDFVYSDHICIRAYNDLNGLVPLNPPRAATFPKGFEVGYELAYDIPISSDSVSNNEEHLTPQPSDVNKFTHKVCSKIGGYSSDIQYEPFEDGNLAKPEFCLQINSEMKVGLVWGDSGSLYIARGTAKGYEDKWFFDIQFF
jgi:hypothetical protein